MRMKAPTLKIALCCALLLTASTTWLAAEETADEKIARAMTAAPTMISSESTVVDDDGTVLREGSNGWVCAPNVFPNDGYPICADEVWQGWIGAFKQRPDRHLLHADG